MKVLMTGATGFLGHHIARVLLQHNHTLVILSRSEKSARERFPYPCQIFSWNPMREAPPEQAWEGVQGVIHLAGESVAGGRWSAERKKKIVDSRVLGTRNLWNGIKQNLGRGSANPLEVFVSASAIGFYGNRGDEELVESAQPGNGFLADVCRAWEKEIFQLGFDQIRQVAVRIGVVMGREGGALEKLTPLFRAGLGGLVGSGKQWMSWIHVEDLARVFVEILENGAYRGPVNAVAPHLVTNRDFSKTLGRVLHRPAIMAAPALALRLALGEMATMVLEGQKVKAERLTKNGFRFEHPELEGALRDILVS